MQICTINSIKIMIKTSGTPKKYNGMGLWSTTKNFRTQTEWNYKIFPNDMPI